MKKYIQILLNIKITRYINMIHLNYVLYIIIKICYIKIYLFPLIMTKNNLH